jgi:lipopolysaccharide exporter
MAVASVAEGAVRGAIWNVATTVVTRLAGLVGTLVITHFLAPNDLGEVAAASVCVLTAMMATQLRYGNYVIAKQATPEESYNGWIAGIVLGVVGFVVVIALRDPLGAYFGSPNSGKYVPGLAIAALMERFAYIPERLLIRDLKFRPLALARSAGELTYTVVSLGSAIVLSKYELGGYAIVIGNLARSFILTAMTMRAATWKDYAGPLAKIKAKLSWSKIKMMTSYSAPGALAGLAELAAYRWDNLLVSRYFGPSQHGRYNLAYSLADTPTGAVGEQVADVLFPSFAKLEPERREPALRRATALMGLVVFPLAVGLGAIAPTVVPTFFDPRWAEVAPMLTILSVLSIARTMAAPLVGFMQAQHRQRALMVLSVAKVVILLVGIRIFAPYGPLWTCVGVGGTFILDTLLCMIIVRVLDGIRMLPLLAGLIPVFLASAIMAAGVYGVRLGLRGVGVEAGWLSLILEIITGGIVYVVAAFVVARPLAMDILEQVRRVIRRRRGQDS